MSGGLKTQLEDYDAVIETVFVRELRQELKRMVSDTPQTPTPPPIANAIKAQLQDLADKAGQDGAHDVRLAALQEMSDRPGWRTTEFYLSLVCGTLGGVLLYVPGKELIGACLVAVGTLSYNLSRGFAKKGS